MRILANAWPNRLPICAQRSGNYHAGSSRGDGTLTRFSSAQIILKLFATLLHRRKRAHDAVGGPAFALDTAYARETAAGINLFHCVSRTENLVKVADGAYIGIAGICPPHARRVSDHGLQLLANQRLRVTDKDVVVVGL